MAPWRRLVQRLAREMETLIVQDWVTICGPTGTSTITQSEQAWQEIPGVASAVAWLDVRDVNLNFGQLALQYQAAPLADESLFSAVYGPFVPWPSPLTPGVTVTPLIKDLMGFYPGGGPNQALMVPTPVLLSRWFRWQLQMSFAMSAWDITFRLFLSVSGRRG